MKRLTIIFGIFFLTFSLFGQLKVTSGNVNFRTSPEIKENKICTIPEGTLVSIVKDTIQYKNWTKINYTGKTGYVYNEFLTDISVNTKKYDNNNSLNTETKYYKNSKGKKVQSPTYYKSQPAEATAECNDGTYSFSKNRRGTCSHHGGVKKWLP